MEGYMSRRFALTVLTILLGLIDLGILAAQSAINDWRLRTVTPPLLEFDLALAMCFYLVGLGCLLLLRAHLMRHEPSWRVRLAEFLIIAWVIRGGFAYTEFSAPRDRSRIADAIQRCRRVSEALESYWQQKGVFPAALDELGLPPELLRDPWGFPAKYHRDEDGTGCELRYVGVPPRLSTRFSGVCRVSEQPRR